MQLTKKLDPRNFEKKMMTTLHLDRGRQMVPSMENIITTYDLLINN